MTKLQKLTQDEEGHLFRKDGSRVEHGDVSLFGRIQTLTLQNGVDVSKVVDEMTERKSAWIPRGANAYISSAFTGDSQHLRRNENTGEEKFFSTYAVQFMYDWLQE